jgi:hypothetical protein
VPFDIHQPTTCLAAAAQADLERSFAAFGHAPSVDQWAAINDLLHHLELAAAGHLNAALHVSAIPAGTGKSASLAAFAHTLLTSADHSDVGMVVFVNRIAEAKDMADAVLAKDGDHCRRLCVITSDAAVNALGGHAQADEAQLVIATQAALKTTLKSLHEAPFGAASRFHYRGQRRAVVCWDEAFAFNRPVTLDADTVTGLARAMRRQSDDAAHTLKRWSCDLDACKGGLVSVPDFEGLGVDFVRLEDDVGDQDELVAQAKALAVISGDQGYVTHHGAASVLVTHYPEIPPSLMPVIVTDASARVNASYTQMMRCGVALRWLKDAPKTYRNLTLRIVPTSASRSTYRDLKSHRGRDLIDMVARYIASVPGEDVLVIGYKGRFNVRGVVDTSSDHKVRGTLEAALRSRLAPEDQARVHYVAYGRHTATNAFKHVRHVILMGLNFIPKAAGHAASGAALNLDLIKDHPTNDQIAAMTQGMLMDSTLQALLRGNARMGVGGDCGVMEAVIPQTKQTGLSRSAYQGMFPGAVIVDDNALMPSKPLKGRLNDLAGILARRLAAGEAEMTNESLYRELGVDKSNFAKLVKRPEWQAHIAALGLNPQRLRGHHMGLRVVAIG